ncbi:MAG TPA: hypothetical protein VGB77_05845 [Abditibacteriaceae bacterium]|jgi:hypothetical protein
MRLRFILALLCGTYLCLASFGCRRSTEETQSQTASTNGAKKSSQNAKGKPDKKSVAPVKVAGSKTKTKENGRKTEKASLQDFPKDLPLYPGAKVLGVGTSDKGVVVGLESKDAPQKVMDFYQYKLNAQGWTGKSATTTKQGGILEAEKKPRRCIVTVGFKRKTKVTAFSLAVLNK